MNSYDPKQLNHISPQSPQALACRNYWTNRKTILGLEGTGYSIFSYLTQKIRSIIRRYYHDILAKEQPWVSLESQTLCISHVLVWKMTEELKIKGKLCFTLFYSFNLSISLAVFLSIMSLYTHVKCLRGLHKTGSPYKAFQFSKSAGLCCREEF